MLYGSLGVICMSWTTVLQVRSSGERLAGFKAVCAVLRRGGVARRGYLGVPLGPVWVHFGHHLFDVFLEWLFGGLGLHLGPPEAEIHRFCIYLPHFGHIQGC